MSSPRFAWVAGRPRRLGGWRRPVTTSRHPAFASSSPAVQSFRIPLIPSTQDQAQEGSCTAQTWREVMTGLGMRDGLGEVILSAQAFYAWERQADGTPLTQDDGSTIETGASVLLSRGIPTESAWPYSMPLAMPPSAAAEADAATRKGQLVFSLPNLDTIKASIAQGFGVAFGFEVPKQMMTDECAATGLVEYPADPSGFDGSGHAVSGWGFDDGLVIGVGPTQTVGAIYCLNHWSVDFGVDGGRFWLPYKFFQQLAATDAHTVRLATKE